LSIFLIFVYPVQEKETRLDDLNPFLEPGMYVRHPTERDWGIGQVQSSIKGKVTVNFEETGKVVIDGTRISLEIVSN
tara:strand:- start:104 stop:334 length:231 start_codon:yes stop_codon:yes gene_type:complete